MWWIHKWIQIPDLNWPQQLSITVQCKVKASLLRTLLPNSKSLPGPRPSECSPATRLCISNFLCRYKLGHDEAVCRTVVWPLPVWLWSSGGTGCEWSERNWSLSPEAECPGLPCTILLTVSKRPWSCHSALEASSLSWPFADSRLRPLPGWSSCQAPLLIVLGSIVEVPCQLGALLLRQCGARLQMKILKTLNPISCDDYLVTRLVISSPMVTSSSGVTRARPVGHDLSLSCSWLVMLMMGVLWLAAFSPTPGLRGQEAEAGARQEVKEAAPVLSPVHSPSPRNLPSGWSVSST